jgi:hypothetical protein
MNYELRKSGSSPWVAKMEMHLQSQVEQLESIRRGIAEIEGGHYIPHEAMKVWLLSLSSDHYMLPPKCVCGRSHDEDGGLRQRKAEVDRR